MAKRTGGGPVEGGVTTNRAGAIATAGGRETIGTGSTAASTVPMQHMHIGQSWPGIAGLFCPPAPLLMWQIAPASPSSAAKCMRGISGTLAPAPSWAISASSTANSPTKRNRLVSIPACFTGFAPAG